MSFPTHFCFMLAPLLDRWFLKIAPFVYKGLLDVTSGSPYKTGAAARHELDPLLYSALCGLVEHDESLFHSFCYIVWRGVRYDMARGHLSALCALYLDVVLRSKHVSARRARGVAAILDSVGMQGTWDDATLSRYLRQTAKTDTASNFDGTAHGGRTAILEEWLSCVQKVDTPKFYASPTDDEKARRLSSHPEKNHHVRHLAIHPLCKKLWI